MKRCPPCGELKPPSEFYRNRSQPDGCSIQCKQCTLERQKAYRAARAATRPKREPRKSLAVEVREIKATTPCLDCGVQYPPAVMHFDHVRGEKVATINTLVRVGSRGAVMDEIAKCEIRCANCHYIRHEQERECPLLS